MAARALLVISERLQAVHVIEDLDMRAAASKHQAPVVSKTSGNNATYVEVAALVEPQKAAHEQARPRMSMQDKEIKLTDPPNACRCRQLDAQG